MKDWFEIFRTGTHTDSGGNTRDWNESDLDKIAEGYNPQIHEAPIVIGHPETNAPAYGWIDKLKRVGDRLLAFPKEVVAEFADAVKQGLFKKRSISLFPDGSLRHIGFLGGAIPAVKGLKDLAFNSEDSTTEIEVDVEPPIQEVPNVPIVPPEENIKPDYAAQFAESESRRKAAEEKLHQLEAKLRISEFTAYLKDKTSQGKLTPAQSEKLLSLMHSAESSDFSEGKKDIVHSIKDFVETLQPQFSLGELTPARQEAQPAFPKSPSQIIAEEINKKQNSQSK